MSSACKFVGLALLACFVRQVNASSDPVTILRDVAYSHPLTLAVAREVDAAVGDQAGARWQRFPTLGFVSQTPHDRARQGDVNRLSIDQPLYAGGKISAGIDVADARHRGAQSRHDQVAQEMAIKLITTWYEWRRARAKEQVLNDGVEAHRLLSAQIERRVAEGVSPSADATLAVARLSQMRSDLALTQSAARTAYAQLKQLAREVLPVLEGEGFVQKVAVLPTTPPPAAWRDLAIERDPALAKLNADYEAAGAEIRVKKGQIFPVISFRVEKDFSAQNSALTGERDGYRAMIQLSAQPGAGLSALSAVDAASSRKDAALENMRNAELELAQALDIDFAEYLAAEERMQVAGLLLRSTQEVAESYSRQFVTGKKSWLDVLNSLREAVTSRLSIHDAEALRGQTWWRLRLRALGFAGY